MWQSFLHVHAGRLSILYNDVYTDIIVCMHVCITIRGRKLLPYESKVLCSSFVKPHLYPLKERNLTAEGTVLNS